LFSHPPRSPQTRNYQWRAYWKRTGIQGTIINTGGIMASTKFPLHHRAEFLNGRDLYGDVANAAHDDGPHRPGLRGLQSHR
jgi:hypothetical protein